VAEDTEALARKIADRTSGAIALEHARMVAEADHESALMRDAKRALIDRTDIFGDFKTPPLIPTDPSKDPCRFLRAKANDLLPPEQQEEAARSVAIKRVLSELTNLSLYEKRRGRAARSNHPSADENQTNARPITKFKILHLVSYTIDCMYAFLAKRTQFSFVISRG
jgi:hypothetical protein